MNRPEKFTIGVIISTYNNHKWLEKTLWGYDCQTHKPDEIIIADDGSTRNTAEMINKFREKSSLNIVHVWHEDNGFQKCRILNLALMQAKSDYIIFTDQDCIPREDFVKTHYDMAQQGMFLSGGYFRLPMDLSKDITEDDVRSGKAFKLEWLLDNGAKFSFKCTKLVRNEKFCRFMNSITTTKATWNGCNASGWRSDMLVINGFNEQMQYGGQDREFGERLVNLGLKGVQVRYSAICLHLDHKRPYKTIESISKNVAIRKETRKSGITVTPYGIAQISDEDKKSVIIS